MELTRFLRPTAPFFYKYGSANTDERMQWLADTILRHELYLPLATELNDLREGRPRLLRRTLVEIANQIGIDASTFRVEQLNQDAELTTEVHAVVAQTVHGRCQATASIRCRNDGTTCQCGSGTATSIAGSVWNSRILSTIE
jgi:hypothetical protein